MPTFSGGNGGASFTPSTTNDNYTLDAVGGATGTFGKVVAIGWGGRLTSSTGYRTRWTRPNNGAGAGAGVGAGTAITLAYHQPLYTSAQMALNSTYATTQPVLPTDPAGNLHQQDWNAQGGVGMVVLPLANPWWCVKGVLQGSISCRNVAGTDLGGSSYEVTWEE